MSAKSSSARRLARLGQHLTAASRTLEPACELEPAASESGAAGGARLRGKVAVVTGGGTGIGEAIVKSLHAEGCAVWAVGRRIEPLQGLAAACPGVEIRSVDVADEDAVGALFAEVRIFSTVLSCMGC